MSIRQRRLRNQHLVGEPAGSPEQVVWRLCAVQAQDYAGAAWAIGQRTAECTRSDVDAACAAGHLVRTHVMRPTWHVVRAEDLPWLMAATAHRVHVANTSMYTKLDLDEATRGRTTEALVAALADGAHLTRTELGKRLGEDGVRMGYILMSAEIDGVIVSGAMQGKQHTYALAADRLPSAAAVDRDEAAAMLAARYLAGHGPALVEDLAWWSGLTKAEASRALADSGASHEELDGRTYWALDQDDATDAGASAHLLPNYDEYFIAYRDRSTLAAAFDVEPPEGFFHRHVVAIDGFVLGAWQATVKRSNVAVEITLLVDAEPPAQALLRAAADRHARHLDLSLDLTIGKAS
ncbi:winged helix DNA-binding domain-containing protein [Aeromicrobium sp. NPDC092404]|uniref:winged helix DNA-binding domain-containing protein n=1 Tax=Aeromicrobium sp. NPDC092404 TaxID=3154976 RepID=UPI00342EE254